MKKRLRKQVKAVLMVIAGGITLSITHNPAPSKVDKIKLKETIPVDEISEPSDLKEYQQVNSNISYLLVFEDEGIERRIPVIETGDSSYALTHDIYGNKNSMGSVFTDASAYEPQNLVIYGHSSLHKDEAFTFLKKMKEREYYVNHPVFTIESREGISYCHVVSFGEYDLEDEEVYTDWALSEFENADAVRKMFSATIPNLIEKTDGMVYRGQKLVTLVTCDMEKEDARYVLQAFRQSDG